MAEKIGRFEIASQLAQSSFATVYKAVDTESQQTVALKVVDLGKVKDRSTLLKAVFAEAGQAKPLNSHNIAALYGVGDEGNLLLAAMEYVQGNSVATTLARHDGFSIWDLQDIARQVCQALDHAQVHKVVHQSLEPAKIMVQWDGMVKILAFGSSLINSQAMELTGAVPEVLHYASPEQLRGEPCDHRSALFSLGAILYEMATEQKAFTGESADQVRTAILESTPPLPHRLKANVNQGLSSLIMKALAKSPDERYQSGQELVRDLEQCKSGNTLAAQSKAAPAPQPPEAVKAPVSNKANAAAAGISASPSGISTPVAKASDAPAATPSKPRFAVDPMMAEPDDAAGASHSFSEISELPPLKEAYTPPTPPSVEQPQFVEPAAFLKKPEPEKPRMQMREAAQRAAHAIRKTPPKLYLYSVGAAVFLIALYISGMALYNYIQDRDTSGPVDLSPVMPTAEPEPAPAPQPAQASSPQAQPQPEEAASQPEASPVEEQQPTTTGSARRGKNKRAGARATTAIVPGQLTVSSTPSGAQISFDGSDLCQSPCTLTGIAPGEHTVIASKAGYSRASRTVGMVSGGNASIALELVLAGATLSVTSTPAGAVILVDGKDTGKLTPSQFASMKPGAHTVVLQRAGYLEQSTSVNVEAGQASTVNLSLTQLGNTDDIRAAGGKFKKVFGRGGDTSGMGTVSIKTQPKGAQIMINNRVLDKTTPFDFYLNPGTYVLDITMSGYKGLHRVITIQEGEKLVIQEMLSTE
jgi:serine/threonine protein kinase